MEEVMSSLPLPTHGQEDEEEWQRAMDSVEAADSRSLWVDGRFYIDLATGHLHMAVRSGSIVLTAANPAERPVLEDILNKIVEYQRG
jgi:hypothetical protein